MLVDDVYTSGATVNECSRVLKQARASEVFVVTLARAVESEIAGDLMSQDDQIRWDRQHGESQGREQPALFLRQVFDSGHADITAGRALDIACGSGPQCLISRGKRFRGYWH